MNLTVEQRVDNIEQTLLVHKTRWRALWSAGIIFWGLSSGLVYTQLARMNQALDSLVVVESQVSLLNFRANQQDVFNSRLIQNEETYKTQVQARFDRLQDDMTRMYRQSPQ